MSALYDKVVLALQEHAHRTEAARALESAEAGPGEHLTRRIKVNPGDLEALRAELGLPGVKPLGVKPGHLWTPGVWLLGVDLMKDDSVPAGDVLLETVIREWIR